MKLKKENFLVKNNRLLFQVSLLICVVFFSQVYGQTIVINEIVSDNETIVQDQDGDYEDWIELYNTDEFPTNLAGLCLSDDGDSLAKWVFPEVTIPAFGFITVFASDKNRLDTTEFHTNFKISSSGEVLYLSTLQGDIIDQTEAVELDDDEAYGRFPDGGSNWIKSYNASFGAPNIFFNQLDLSSTAGFYDSPFYLKIECESEDTIYYTLDGSVPTDSSFIFEDSVLMDFQYNQPNVLSEIPTSPPQELLTYKAWSLPEVLVDKAIVMKCASRKNGSLTSPIYTNTYFVDSTIFEKYNLSIVSLITDSQNLFSQDSGIYVPGVNYSSGNPEYTGNYFMSGDDWERPVYIQYFEQDGSVGFSQNAGIRIHGGKTKQAAQKSLRLYARNEYGEKYFNYNLLPNRQVEKYKRIVFRATMGAFFGETIFADALAQDIVRGLDFESQDFEPIAIFINGEYWGIHTVMDRVEERYIEYVSGVDKDSVCLEELFYDESFWDLKEIIVDMDFSIDENYVFIQSIIDINSFMDYHISEMFFANIDWPRSNNKWWRKTTPDSKWRWVFYDLDAAFEVPSYDMFRHMTLNTGSWPYFPDAAMLFRKLITNANFVELFSERYNFLLSNNFDPNVTLPKLEAVKQMYQNEVPRHIERWHFPGTYESWESDVDTYLHHFLEVRSEYVLEHMEDALVSNESFETQPKGFGNFRIYPNPAKDFVYIKKMCNESVEVDIDVFNGYGEVVYSEQGVRISGFGESNRIALQGCGVYFIRLSYDSTNEYHKLMLGNK